MITRILGFAVLLSALVAFRCMRAVMTQQTAKTPKSKWRAGFIGAHHPSQYTLLVVDEGFPFIHLPPM